MGVSGAWYAKAVQDYTGATRWGTGINPIHGVRDNTGGSDILHTKQNLIPLGEPSDAVSQAITDPDIDWLEDYSDTPYEGEWFRYQDDLPRWDKATPQFRDGTNNPAMGQQASWGVFYNSDPYGLYPLPGPTAGMQGWLDVDHGEVEEQQHAIAVPTQPVTGGWLSKVRGDIATPMAQDPNQNGFVWTINNASVQGPGLKELSNDRAVTRGTDAPRSSVQSRTAGQVIKVYAQSFGMGGGPGTPDMRPFQQTADLKRPFFRRQAAVPPPEAHTWNSVEYRDPMQRTLTPDPYQGAPETGGQEMDMATEDWGY